MPDVLWLYLLLLIIFVIFFDLGLLHIVYAHSCRKEAKHKGSSPTSNSKKPFMMQVSSFEKKTAKTILEGTLTGTLPTRGDVVYLLVRQKKVPVFIRKISVLAEDPIDYDKRVHLSAFGAKKALKDLLPGEKLLISNVRESYKVKPLREAEGDIFYPFTIRMTVKEFLTDLMVFLVGAGCLILCFLDYRSSGEISGTLIITSAAGAFMTVTGLWMLYSDISFKMVFQNEKTVVLYKGLKRVNYHSGSLRNMVYMPSDKKEHWNMRIFDDKGKVIRTLNDKHPYFGILRKLFNENRKLRSAELIWNYIRDKAYYVPAVIPEGIENPEYAKLQPEVLSDSENEHLYVMAYETEELMREKAENARKSCLQLSVEELVKYTGNFNWINEIYMKNSEEVPFTEAHIDCEVWKYINKIRE